MKTGQIPRMANAPAGRIPRPGPLEVEPRWPADNIDVTRFSPYDLCATGFDHENGVARSVGELFRKALVTCDGGHSRPYEFGLLSRP